jgi:hypothetical protein
MARQTVCVTYGAEASAYVAIACDIAAGIVTGKAAVQAAAKKAAQEAAEQAWKAIPKAEKAIIGNVLKGKLPREAFDKLSESTKKAAIERFKQTAANPSGSMGDAASKLNQARVDFLEGRLANPPGGIGNF